ncbi:MAG TPA: MFS transporter [Polyangia bacterium]|nr:MFS transporter [Polyangia bacterium]
MTDPEAVPAPEQPPGAVGLLAAIAAISVANLYYAQPLAAMLAASFRVSVGAIGLALMLSQLGYALGMLLLVPLGDGRERRGLMIATALASATALVAVSLSPSFRVLAVASLVLGFVTCLPQMAVPFAVGLVSPAARGKAIGVVMGGLLGGILLSRTVSGTLAGWIGWRATFLGAGAVMAALALVIRVALPVQRPPVPLPWVRILASLGHLIRSQPLLRRHALVGACGFAGFSVFWSTLAFHLAHLGHGARTAGLFGALGVAGVAVAPIVGRLAGRIRATRINLVGLLGIIAGFGVFALAGPSLFLIGVGVVLLDAGVQASHLANQTIIFGLAPELRNRVNAVYMVTYFIGGALGTVAAALAFQRWGWSAVCALGALSAAAGIAPIARRAAR